VNVNLRLSFVYGLTIFLSAFLLFQVQPLIGKLILPWFGGSASVWTTCMLFFQAILLLGYVYSHWIVKALKPYQQSLLHLLLLALSLIFLPVSPSEVWKPTGAENPTYQILGLLLVSIGLPYFVLSTTGPLIQAWFAREKVGGVPYRLFALSNFGSMIALLAYPTVFEPTLPARTQSYAWSSLFLVFIASCAYLAWRNRHSTIQTKNEEASAMPPKHSDLITWVVLAACPSILMVADTSFLTENIAPIPLIWVAPLALYLLSFIFCFEGSGWYQRKTFLPLLVLSLFVLAYLPTLGMNEFPTIVSMGINLLAFFVVCMVCHGEIALQQPNSRYLTIYYLMLALGGFFGGLFVGVIAPYSFNGNYELSIGILLAGIAVSISVFTKIPMRNRFTQIISALCVFAYLIALGTIRIHDHLAEINGAELSVRNFYGTLRVSLNEKNGYRTMRHGQIIHGRQFTAPHQLLEPTTYYIHDSGVGQALLNKQSHAPSIKVGIVGLGVGTLAAYGRAHDTFRFYEINPQVIEIANTNFSFLSKTSAHTEMVLGDARLKLEHEPNQDYDVLVVDAFSGDSVPIHLLTHEAFAEYFRHLKPNGILALHITNRFLDLRPVVKTAADEYGAQIRLVKYAEIEGKVGFRSHWALLTRDKNFFDEAHLVKAETLETPLHFRPWTDDYSSLISIMY